MSTGTDKALVLTEKYLVILMKYRTGHRGSAVTSHNMSLDISPDPKVTGSQMFLP